MRILHITRWYPNVTAPEEAPFIARHISALEPHAQAVVWHVDVRGGAPWGLETRSLQADRTWILSMPTRRYLIQEWAALLIMIWGWLTRPRSLSIDAINFHVAYPNCSWIGVLRRLMRRPMLITEHWSAFRRHFGLPPGKGHRIKRIFHKGIPVITVSRALQKDIEDFAGPPFPPFHIIDNAVDPSVFHHDASAIVETGRFFSLSGWRFPKRPLVLIDAFAWLRDQGVHARLTIGGSGTMIPAMKERIAELGLTDRIELLGHLNESQVAHWLQRSHAFVHASDYETYSAACAEALSCGTPVVASNVGGIPEFVGEADGKLVDANEAEAFGRAISAHWDWLLESDRVSRSKRMHQRAGKESVGRRYAAVVQSILQVAKS